MTKQKPGTEPTAEAAAAMAAGFLVFEEDDPIYAQNLLNHSRTVQRGEHLFSLFLIFSHIDMDGFIFMSFLEIFSSPFFQLFNFSITYKAKYQQSVPKVAKYYNSSGYEVLFSDSFKVFLDAQLHALEDFYIPLI